MLNTIHFLSCTVEETTDSNFFTFFVCYCLERNTSQAAAVGLTKQERPVSLTKQERTDKLTCMYMIRTS